MSAPTSGSEPEPAPESKPDPATDPAADPGRDPSTAALRRRAVRIALVVMVASALLTAALFAIQIQRSAHQISGRVVSVAEDQVVIVNRRGDETVVRLTDQTRFPRHLAPEERVIEPGDFVHSFGDREGRFVFEARRIRVVGERAP